MAKKSWVLRRKKRENLCYKYLAKRNYLVNFINNKQTAVNLKRAALFELQSLPRNSNKTRLNNICLVTGRSGGFFRFFGMSRTVIRTLALNCWIAGFTKSSW